MGFWDRLTGSAGETARAQQRANATYEALRENAAPPERLTAEELQRQHEAEHARVLAQQEQLQDRLAREDAERVERARVNLEFHEQEQVRLRERALATVDQGAQDAGNATVDNYAGGQGTHLQAGVEIMTAAGLRGGIDMLRVQRHRFGARIAQVELEQAERWERNFRALREDPSTFSLADRQ
jgi:hypothetical protein